MITAALVAPGDILAVRSPGTAGRLIRFGSAMRELVTGAAEPNLDNHIAVVHHTDKAGTLWVLEGRPGGVGWRQASDYLASPWTLSNAGQPKTPAQRKAVCDAMHAIIGVAYDWEAIAADAGDAFGLDRVWQPGWDGKVPGHVVCSSSAAYAYTKAGLGRPDQVADGREVTPADWVAFILGHGYQDAGKVAA